MTGPTRAERVAMARKLRAEGLLIREIAARMGVATSTAHQYLSDPDLELLKARKDSYRGRCVVCDGPTDGSSGPGNAPELCMTCRTWTEDKIIAAMRAWAARHGGLPPTATDWRHADTDHPCARSQGIRRVGWNELLLRAGFGLRRDRRPETQEWIEAQLRAGLPVAEVADRLGVTPSAIHMRMRTRGTTVERVRAAA